MTEDVREQPPASIGAEGNPRGETPADLFELLWETLADVLGPATTATLVGRSLKYASARQPLLGSITIKREVFQYRYVLPDMWSTRVPVLVEALREVVVELNELLVPLTGSIVVRRLENLIEFQRAGLLPPKVSR